MNENKDNRPNGNRPDRNGPGNQGPNKNRQTILAFLICLLVTLVCLSFITEIRNGGTGEITYDKFIEMVDKDQIKEVTLQSGILTVEPKLQGSSYKKMTYRVNQMENIDALTKRLEGKDIIFKYEQPDALMEALSMLLSIVLPTVVMFGMLMFFMRRMNRGNGGIMGVGKSRAKAYVQKETGITFKNVAGQDEAKESLQEVVDFLHNPGKYTAVGAKLPKGALLVGPPGTGKTLLAKAVAGEAKVPFFSLSGSEFVEMFVGVGASRVRDLFKQASAKAPCIIFIDEIDAIGKSRDNQISSNDEREQTLNQLLSEMDGFDSSKGLVILAATNRPEVLDKALLRPGRFDRRIIVEKPDLKGREDILRVHIKHVKTEPDINLHEMALATSGAAGADLANMVNEAALRAVRCSRKTVSQEDLMEAVEVIIAGKEKKDRILSEKEKRIVSFHEVGHALATAVQKHTQPVHKITIVPRTMGSLGYTMQMPEEEERYLMSKDEIVDQITVFLAGRAAEELVFNVQTTGASNDIERATSLARNMITQYGMSEKFGMAGLESIQNKYLDGRNVSNCSEETKTDIDKEVVRVLKECHEKAFNILKENRDALDEIAEFLINKETITGDQFMEIFNRVKSGRENSDSDAEESAAVNEENDKEE